MGHNNTGTCLKNASMKFLIVLVSEKAGQTSFLSTIVPEVIEKQAVQGQQERAGKIITYQYIIIMILDIKGGKYFYQGSKILKTSPILTTVAFFLYTTQARGKLWQK